MRTDYVMYGLGATMLSALAGTMLLATMNVSNKERANAGKQFPAPPYRWSDECPPRDYLTKAQVPSACARSRYRLGSVWKLGLSMDGGKGTHWFRLGDDAVALRCAPFANICTVRQVVIGKFMRSVETPR